MTGTGHPALRLNSTKWPESYRRAKNRFKTGAINDFLTCDCPHRFNLAANNRYYAIAHKKTSGNNHAEGRNAGLGTRLT